MKIRIFVLLLCFTFVLSGAAFAADAPSSSTTIVTVPAVEGFYPAEAPEVFPDFREYEALLPTMLEQIFGHYQPLTQEVKHYFPDGSSFLSTEYVEGAAGLDYTYIASVVIFIIALYCVFRIIGGVFKCK